MSNYFILKSNQFDDPDIKGYIEIEDWEGSYPQFNGWSVGVSAAEVPTESAEIGAAQYGDFDGAPNDLNDFTIPLMSARLKAALGAAGVSNVQYAPVRIRNKTTGETYDYFAFNLVGLVAAADFEKSDLKSYDGDFTGETEIHSLTLDESRIGKLLMFRLKEKFSVIVVHRNVKEAIEHADITTLSFIEPKDFMAL
jgi:hypothetical protein